MSKRSSLCSDSLTHHQSFQNWLLIAVLNVGTMKLSLDVHQFSFVTDRLLL